MAIDGSCVLEPKAHVLLSSNSQLGERNMKLGELARQSVEKDGQAKALVREWPTSAQKIRGQNDFINSSFRLRLSVARIGDAAAYASAKRKRIRIVSFASGALARSRRNFYAERESIPEHVQTFSATDDTDSQRDDHDGCRAHDHEWLGVAA